MGIQRRPPLHGLAADRAIAFDRDSFGDEAGGRRLQLESMDSWFRLCPHDRVWSLRVTSRLAGSVGLPPCLSSCTSSTSSSLVLQLLPPANPTHRSRRRLAQRK